MNNLGRLENKIALITGGCSGMGLATVELFIKEGAKVIVADILEEQGIELVEKYPGDLQFIKCDVTKEDNIAAAVDLAVKEYGGLDITFNNAGAPGYADPLEHTQIDRWDYTMNLLLRSVLLGIKHSIAPMRARGGGSIINTASLSGVTTIGTPDYCAAKAGVLHLSRVAALELGCQGIRVNSILPGIILTPLFGKSFLGMNHKQSEELVVALEGKTTEYQPLKRTGKGSDIAEACLFFASDASAFLTGTELRVDGGASLYPQMDLNPESAGSLGELIVQYGQKIKASL